MSDMVFTLPLVVSTTIPIIIGILPLLLVSLILLHPTLRSHLIPKDRLPTDPSFGARTTTEKKASTNDRNAVPRPSKSSLNLRPLLLSAQAMASDRKKMVRREDFGITPRPSEEHDARLRGLFRGSNEPRIGRQDGTASIARGKGQPDSGQSGSVKSALGVMAAAGISILSGVLYLSLAGSTANKALEIALAISITSLPFAVTIYTVYYTTAFLSTYSPLAPLLLGIVGAIGISALSTYTSIYIAVAFSGTALVYLTFVLVTKTNIWNKVRGRRGVQLPLDEKKGDRGEEMGEDDGRQTSWLTENMNSGETTEPFSSFSYDTTIASARPTSRTRQRGESTHPSSPFILGDSDSESIQTPRTPEMARTRSSSRMSDTRPGSAMGKSSMERMRKSSWITEPSKTPTSFSSFSFGEISEPVPKIPQGFRGGAARTSEDGPGGRSILNEGPSILKSSDPFEMSYTSLTNNGVGIRPLRGKSSTLSEETYHSAIDEGDQSFPRSVSMSFSDAGASHPVGESKPYIPGQSGEHEHLVDEEDMPRRGPSMESKRSRAPSPIGEPPAMPLPVCPAVSARGRPRASSDATDFSQADRMKRSDSRATISRPGSTVPQYISMPVKMTEDGPLPSAAGRVSPFSYNSVITPATTAFGSNGKYSTDPLLLPGVPTGRETATGFRGNEIEELIEAADIANETSLMEENEKAGERIGLILAAGVVALWVCWALAIPLCHESEHTTVILFLVSLLLPTPTIIAACLLLDRVSSSTLQSLLSDRRKVNRASQVVIMSDEYKTGLDGIAEMSSRFILPSITRPRTSIDTWARAFPRLSKVGYKNTGAAGDRQPHAVPSSRGNDLEAGNARNDIQMHRLSGDIWLENGHARRTSGKLDRLIGMMAPLPQLAIVSSPKLQEDPNATPRASKLNARAVAPLNLSPISFRAGPRYEDIPAQPPCHPAVLVNTPTRTDRSSYRNSATTSPGAKSVAEVKTATRARMSQTPVFLFGGRQGDMIMTPRPSMEACGLVDEAMVPSSISKEKPGPDNAAILETNEKKQRRRTLELAKDFLGISRNEQKSDISNLAKSKDAPHPPTAHHATPGGRTSCSTTRRSMDLPPFRPSLDFVPPPLPVHGASTSFDLGNTSFRFDGAQEAQHSTPYGKSSLQRRGSHKNNQSLPTISPKTGLLQDVKQALKQYGRSIDTPAKTPKQDLSTHKQPRNNAGSTKSPLRGILKSRPSLDTLASGLDLPPIPTQMRKAADKEAKAARKNKISTSSSTKASPGMTGTNMVSPPPVKTLGGERVPVPHTPLDTVSERDEASNRSLSSQEGSRSVGHATCQPEAIDPGRLDENGLQVDGFELSFDHDPDQLEEMEMVMTQLDRAATNVYVSSHSEKSLSRSSSFSRPHSFAGSTTAAQTSTFLPVPHLRVEADNKVSTDTLATIESFGGGDPVQDSPSPALRTQPSRDELVLAAKRSRESYIEPKSAREPQAVTSQTISTGGRAALRSSVHGDNYVSRFKRNSAPLKNGLRPLILAAVANKERKTMLTDDEDQENILRTDAKRSAVDARLAVVKGESHGRGDSAFKFDDADEEDSLFTHSPRKVIRSQPLSENRNAINGGSNKTHRVVLEPISKTPSSIVRDPLQSTVNEKLAGRETPRNAKGSRPTSIHRPGSRASTRPSAAVKTARV